MAGEIACAHGKIRVDKEETTREGVWEAKK
jgi:hypothetical protein